VTDCKQEPGAFRPVVDPKRCEGKAECVAVCPYHVFEVGRMTDAVYETLPLLPRLKVWAHRRKTAFTPNLGACRACGKCVEACPEKAIRLERV
jgi:4Fe-4S ferredoxin